MKILFSLLLLSLCGCVDEGSWRYHRGVYGPSWYHPKWLVDPLHWNSGVLTVAPEKHDRYSQPSASAPESLKQFYDPELTRALNQ